MPLKPVLPQRPPANRHPRPPAETDYYDPGVFYLYDNSSPESSYLEGEPCRIVCQSDPSVQCASYTGQCQGLPDRLICDGQTFMCPAAITIAASEQPAQADPAKQAADQADQACQDSDRGQGRSQGGHDGRHQGCHHGCRQGQAKAEVSCSGANAVP